MKPIILILISLLLISVVFAYNDDWKYPGFDSITPEENIQLGSVSLRTQARLYNANWLHEHNLENAPDSEIALFKRTDYRADWGSVGEMKGYRYSSSAYKQYKYDFQGSVSLKYQEGFNPNYRNPECWN